jgi:hypothetical protein
VRKKGRKSFLFLQIYCFQQKDPVIHHNPSKPYPPNHSDETQRFPVKVKSPRYSQISKGDCKKNDPWADITPKLNQKKKENKPNSKDKGVP